MLAEVSHRNALFAHLDAASATVAAAARATLKTSPDLPQVDAAQALLAAATELFHAALDIAEGCPVAGHAAPMSPAASSLAVSLRLAEAKIAEAGARMDGAAMPWDEGQKAA